MDLITLSPPLLTDGGRKKNKKSRKCVCACPPEREREKLIAEREISGMICEDKCDRRLLIT